MAPFVQIARIATFLVACGVFLYGRLTFAQAVDGDPSLGQVDIQFTGTIVSSITIQVQGSVNLRTGKTTTITGAGTAGVVNFGVFAGNGASLPAPLTGESDKVTPGNTGVWVYGTLRAQIFTSGGVFTGDIDIQRTNPIGGVPDVAAGRLVYARPSPMVLNAARNWPKWNGFPENRMGVNLFNMPTSTYVPGAGNLAAGLSTGNFVDHQIGVFIPNAANPNPFATMVTYTATAN